MGTNAFPSTTNLGTSHNPLQSEAVETEREEKATDLSSRSTEEPEVEKTNKESTKTPEKVREEGEKETGRERYVRFKNMDIGSCNDGKSYRYITVLRYTKIITYNCKCKIVTLNLKFFTKLSVIYKLYYLKEVYEY
jgi:hypothetical protein